MTDSPTSVAAWRERRFVVLQLGEGVAVKVRKLDVLAVLGGEKGAPNPLLAAVMGGTQTAKENALAQPENVAALRETLNAMLIRAVIEPPLVEQGHEEGISVDEFSLDEKLFILTELMGGADQLNAAAAFPATQAGHVGAAPGE